MSPYMKVADTGDAEFNLPVMMELWLPNIKLIFNFPLAIPAMNDVEWALWVSSTLMAMPNTL